MSRSPERISSYRRHFEDSSSSSYQVRVSSPSPTRRGTRHAFFGYSCRTGASSMPGESVGRGTISGARRTRMSGAGASAGTLVCVGPNGERPIDLNVAAAENQEFLNTRTNERQEMVVLNDRLAVYIEKVRSLEQKNKLLEAEIEAYRNRFQKPTGLRLLYEEQLKELKKIADQMRVQRDISLAAKDGTAAQLEAIKIKYDEAVELRRKAELDIEALRPDVDKATSSRIVLEKKLEQLEVDIEFLKRVQQQEIDELMNQIYAAHVSVQTAFTLPDLAAALKQIQTQYDDIAAKNLQEMDSWYKNKFEDLTDKTTRHVDTTRSIREEMSSAKKDIQSKEHDLDTLRTRNEALEARIRETQEKYKKELEDLQARIEALQLEMKSTKEKIALHLREYQDLLNVKMSLEIEITTYRKLVEGEDLRLSGMMQTLSLTSCGMSAIGGGMSFGGGGMGGVGGVGGGLIGDSGGSVGGMGRGAGVGEGMGAGGMGGRMGAGGMGGRMGAGGPVDGRADGPDMGGGHGFAVGVGGGVGAGAGGMGTGGDVGAPGMSGVGSGAGSFGARFGELDTGAGDVGAAGLGTSARGVGAAGLGTGAGGVGAAGLGDAGGVGAAALRTNAGGVSAAGLGTGAGGVGAAGFRTGAGGEGAAGLGTGAGSVGLGNGAGGKGDSSRDGLGMGAGGGTTCSDNIEGTGMGFSGGVDGVGGRMSDGICGGIDRYGGMGPASMSSGIRGSGGTKVAGGGDVDALSGIGGMGKVGGGRGDPIVITMGHGSSGYNPNNDNYMQAVELTERRTVLIRTVKNEDDVLEMNHQEKTYTIIGAADDSDDD